MALESTKNKVSILFFFYELDILLSDSQIADYFIPKGLLNFFELQHLLLELLSSGHIESSHIGTELYYSITLKGKDAVNYFGKRIASPIRDDIIVYSNENRIKLLNASQLTSNYQKIADTQYEVNCKAYENNIVLLELKMNVATAMQAKTISNNWQSNASDVYKALIELLT